VINFCLKCFRGHLCLNYNSRKGWGLKCDSCHFRVSILEGAARVLIEEGPEGKCQECDSRMLSATYKPTEERTPFPGNIRQHTGCILCDTSMRATVVNFWLNKKKKPVEEMTEGELKALEEVRRKKEEKKKKKEEAAATAGAKEAGKPEAAEKKPKKPKGGPKAPNKLTQEEIMNDFIKKQMGGA